MRPAGATLRCGARASHCGDFSCCRAQALGTRASVVVAHGLSNGLRALEHRLSSCGARAELLRGMWDLPGPGLKPMPAALAGRFLATAPPGKPPDLTFKWLRHLGVQPRKEFTLKVLLAEKLGILHMKLKDRTWTRG